MREMIPENNHPPSDETAERALLGTILNYPETLGEVATFLRPQHFYWNNHSDIYETASEMYLHQLPIDNVTIGAELEKIGKLNRVGGRTMILLLMAEGYVRQNAIHYAQIIFDCYQKRQIIDIARQVVYRRMDEGLTANELLDEVLGKYFALTSTTGRVAEKLGDNAITDYIATLQNPQPVKLSWPWANLDKILHGLYPGEMTVIGGRPGSGKTAFALNLALDLGMERKFPIGIFSLEMSKQSLVNRMLAQLATVDSSLLRDAKIGAVEWERVLEASITLSQAPIYVDDDSSLSEMDLITKTRKMKYQFGIECIILDYLQLLKSSGKSGNREQEVSGFAQTAKRIARELDVAVVVLSSLNRGPEFREDHRPLISDFRESGGIENEADVILGLYRDHYYNPSADPYDAEVIVLKQRNGPTGTVNLKFEKKYTMFWSETH